MEKLIGVKYLVINALRKQKHSSHFSLGEAIEYIRKISPKRAYITHISHQMGKYGEVSRELPPDIMLAYDGMTFNIDDQDLKKVISS
jgi:phosphoribosyl 1,2-cyclic phosphate phosphodiesterase